tara:strand:- start:1797 stop:2006 length:210 start_codon:yes stop_codon:yes gene_type:complete
MKVDTEWRVGVLAFICNVLACTGIMLTVFIGLSLGSINIKVIWCLSSVYLITLIVLFHFWVDKFNYIED